MTLVSLSVVQESTLSVMDLIPSFLSTLISVRSKLEAQMLQILVSTMSRLSWLYKTTHKYRVQSNSESPLTHAKSLASQLQALRALM